MDFYEWTGRYCEPRWPDPRSYLLRHDNGACVFLDRQDDERFGLCRIYAVRPESCRKWVADPYKPACGAGLKRFWAVTMDDSGRFAGDPGAVERMQRFLSQESPGGLDSARGQVGAVASPLLECIEAARTRAESDSP